MTNWQKKMATKSFQPEVGIDEDKKYLFPFSLPLQQSWNLHSEMKEISFVTLSCADRSKLSGMGRFIDGKGCELNLFIRTCRTTDQIKKLNYNVMWVIVTFCGKFLGKPKKSSDEVQMFLFQSPTLLNA